jgi:hypothetical protein
MPVEHTGPEITGTVLRRLGLNAEKDPLIYRLLERSAQVFALAIVLAVLGAAFVMSGVIDPGGVTADGWMQVTLETKLLPALEASAKWIGTYLPVTGGESAIALAIVLAVILVGLVDRTVGRRFT